MRLYWTDEDFGLLAEVPATTARLVLRHNAAGAASITAPSVPDDAHGIVAASDAGEEIWRGKIRGVSGRDYADTVTAQAVDMLGVLGGFLAWPSVDGDFAAAEYDTYTGAASSAIYHYMRNVTDASAPEWRRLNIALDTDAGIGETVQVSARFDNLLTLIAEIARLGGVRFRFVGGLFTVDYGTVHSDVLYADHAGTAEVHWRYAAPRASVVTAGGAGEGAARTIATVFSPRDLLRWGVIEQFYDVRNVSDAAELTAIARQYIASMESGYSATILPTGGVDSSIIPGDTIRVWADGAERRMVVQSVTYNMGGGWTIAAAERVGILPPSVTDLGLDGLKRSVELLTTK